MFNVPADLIAKLFTICTKRAYTVTFSEEHASLIITRPDVCGAGFTSRKMLVEWIENPWEI